MGAGYDAPGGSEDMRYPQWTIDVIKKEMENWCKHTGRVVIKGRRARLIRALLNEWPNNFEKLMWLESIPYEQKTKEEI